LFPNSEISPQFPYLAENGTTATFGAQIAAENLICCKIGQIPAAKIGQIRLKVA
jgi:hypothetical protein